jgi:hypothetical protein
MMVMTLKLEIELNWVKALMVGAFVLGLITPLNL